MTFHCFKFGEVYQSQLTVNISLFQIKFLSFLLIDKEKKFIYQINYIIFNQSELFIPDFSLILIYIFNFF